MHYEKYNQKYLSFSQICDRIHYFLRSASVYLCVSMGCHGRSDGNDRSGKLFKPGTYISVKDTVESKNYTLNIEAKSSNVGAHVEDKDKASMREWLVKYGGVSQEDMDAADDNALVELWFEKYDSKADQKGLTASKKKSYVRLTEKLKKLASDADVILAQENEDGELEATGSFDSQTYVNVGDVGNKRRLVLGTDTFGRDVLTELVAATKTSLKIGLIAGTVATLIGLILGLLSGYIGGMFDDIIIFITNLFTVIPSFVLLILHHIFGWTECERRRHNRCGHRTDLVDMDVPFGSVTGNLPQKP